MILTEPIVSVVVLNFNTDVDLLDRCISSLLRMEEPSFEIILVDNASTNDSLSHVVRKYGKNPNLRVIRNSANLGFCRGNNVGIELARGDYIALLNPDTEVCSDWLLHCLNEFESKSVLGIVQPKILILDSKDYLLSAGNSLDICGFTYANGVLEKDGDCYNESKAISYADGAAAVIRKTVLDKVGLLDPDFFIYCDTTDLCWRAWISGFHVLYVPKARVYHYGGVSLWKETAHFRAFFVMRNQIRMLIKNLELKNLFKFVPLAVTYLSIYCLYNIRGDIMITYAFLKGLMSNLLQFKSIWKRRARIQSIRKVKDKELLKNSIILGANIFIKRGIWEIRVGHIPMKEKLQISKSKLYISKEKKAL